MAKQWSNIISDTSIVPLNGQFLKNDQVIYDCIKKLDYKLKMSFSFRVY